MSTIPVLFDKKFLVRSSSISLEIVCNFLTNVRDGILNEGPFVLFTFLQRKFVKELRKN